MPYVMLPVPAEHEEEFGQWLIAHTLRAKLSIWPEGAVSEAARRAEGKTRAALALLAARAGLYVDAVEVAAEAEIDPSELVAELSKINQWCASKGWPALVMVRTETDGAGETVESLLMSGQIRRTVLDAVADA